MNERIGHLREAVKRWQSLDAETAEARLFPLAQYMADVYAAALLLEQDGDRKALIARLYARNHLADRGTLRDIDAPAEDLDAPAEDLDRFEELVAGALIDDRN